MVSAATPCSTSTQTKCAHSSTARAPGDSMQVRCLRWHFSCGSNVELPNSAAACCAHECISSCMHRTGTTLVQWSPFVCRHAGPARAGHDRLQGAEEACEGHQRLHEQDADAQSAAAAHSVQVRLIRIIALMTVTSLHSTEPLVTAIVFLC